MCFIFLNVNIPFPLTNCIVFVNKVSVNLPLLIKRHVFNFIKFIFDYSIANYLGFLRSIII